MLCTGGADIKTWGNYIFTGIFGVEAVIKILGLGWPTYWKSMWNKLDMFVVSASIMDIALSSINPGFVRVFNVFRMQKLTRLLRLSRLLKVAKGFSKVSTSGVRRPC